MVTWFNLSVLYIDEIALEFEKKTVSTHFAHIKCVSLYNLDHLSAPSSAGDRTSLGYVSPDGVLHRTSALAPTPWLDVASRRPPFSI